MEYQGSLKIGLVCMDVDGTLVGSSGVIHPRVWSAAERARAAGIHLAICSGRPGFGITRSYAERLEPEGWHVFQNGASVLNLATSRSRSAVLDRFMVDDLIARARAKHRILELYSDVAYAVESSAARAAQHAELLGLDFAPRPLESLGGDVVRAQWLTSHAEADAILAEPHEGLEVSPSSAPLMPDTTFVNLTRAGVDKSSAVRTVAAEYGIPLEHVMYVGDSGNDLTAMRAVGHPVAMANAERDILGVARYTVPHVDEAGLADALEMVLRV